MNPPGDITRLLAAWTEGDQHALEELMPLVYNELRRIARHHWGRQDQGETLQPTGIAPTSSPWPQRRCVKFW
jgi:hypothetical protein